MLLIATLIPLIIGGVFVASIYLLIRETSKQPISQKIRHQHISHQHQHISSSAVPALQTQLIRLTHGDRAAASRLVEGVRRNNPNRSTEWCIEKAIHDLERDRH